MVLGLLFVYFIILFKGAAITFDCDYIGTQNQVISSLCPKCEIIQEKMINELIKNKLYDFKVFFIDIIQDMSICEKWIEFREYCKHVGSEYKYSHNQLYYHYTKNKQYLLNEINEIK